MVFNYVISVILVLLSGLFSGLTLGLMGLDLFELKRKAELGNDDAKKILPLRKNGNLLLCTLLLGNVAVNSALAVFLGSITSGVLAGLISTGLIVVFGEIIPQAAFSRFALVLGARTTWLVRIFMFMLYPATKPLSWMLDKALGDELPTRYSKKEFHMMLKEQKDLKSIRESHFRILEGGLLFTDKQVRTAMTPKKSTFFLRTDDVLTEQKLKLIKSKGYSRIPVFKGNRDNIVGILFAKDLIDLDSELKIPVKSVMRKKVYTVDGEHKLDKLLKIFKQRRNHMLVVKNNFKTTIGIITLEDVIEEIVGDIVDEYDQIVP